MSYAVSLSEGAQYDIDDIISYLSDISTSYAESFILELLGSMDHLEAMPHLFIKLRADYRRLYLKRFKYHVIFKIDEQLQTVTILSIVHESRHPRRWIK